MDPFQVSREPAYYRWIDGLVLLVIGVAIGIVISQSIALFEVGTTTETIHRVRLQRPGTESTGDVTTPDDFISVEES